MQDAEVVFLGRDPRLGNALAETLTTERVFLRRCNPDDLARSPLTDRIDLALLEASIQPAEDLIGEVSQRVGYSVPYSMIGRPESTRAVVRAIRSGALDFLALPLDPQQLVDVVREGKQLAERNRAAAAKRRDADGLLAKLSPREAQVMHLVVDGMLNKQIASELQISEKTVEAHRYRLMRKLRLKTTVDLVKFACQHVPGLLSATATLDSPVPGIAPRYVRATPSSGPHDRMGGPADPPRGIRRN